MTDGRVKGDYEKRGGGTCLCGRWYEAGVMNGAVVAVHEIPYCKEFERKLVNEYLEWVHAMSLN